MVIEPDKVISRVDWEAVGAPKAARDLRIKKCALAILFLINLGAIGTSLYFLVQYVPIPNVEGALLIAPFVGGVLATLLLLKLPTWGMNEASYKNMTNLPQLASRILTLLFFGPTVILKNNLDWLDYSDPYVLSKIRGEFETKNFMELMKIYGPRASNLVAYGCLTKESGEALATQYKNNKDKIAEYDYVTATYAETTPLPDHFADLLKPYNEANKCTAELPKPVLKPVKVPWYNAIERAFAFCLIDESRKTSTEPPKEKPAGA